MSTLSRPTERIEQLVYALAKCPPHSLMHKDTVMCRSLAKQLSLVSEERTPRNPHDEAKSILNDSYGTAATLPINHGILINVRGVSERAYGGLWRGMLWPCGLPSWPMSEKVACKMTALIGWSVRYPALDQGSLILV